MYDCFAEFFQFACHTAAMFQKDTLAIISLKKCWYGNGNNIFITDLLCDVANLLMETKTNNTH